MRLKQTYLNYFSDIVCAVDSALAGRTKLQRFLKIVLRQRLRRCRQRIPKWKLRISHKAQYSGLLR